MNYFKPQPFETVYSWLTRYHFVVSVGYPSNTYKRLFGAEKVRVHPYLPSYLSKLEPESGVSASDWLHMHTLFPLFRFFSDGNGKKLKNAMMEKAIDVVGCAAIPQAKLQLPNAHFFCPVCCESNQSTLGYSYLDIRHQIPGINICPKHNCYLGKIDSGDFGIDRKLVLPRNYQKIEVLDHINLRFAQYCFDVYEIAKRFNSTDRELVSVYIHALKAKGFISQGGNVFISKLTEVLYAYYQESELLRCLPDVTPFKFIGPLLRKKTHFPCHPFKHLLFSFWLFNADASFYLPKSKKKNSHCKPDAPESNDLPGDTLEKILSLLKAGKSMACIERETAKSRCYIRRVAELNNIPHASNQMALPKSIRHAVTIQALLGRHRYDIANSLEVGVGYVEQVISNTKGLSQWRKRLRVLSKITRATLELKTAYNNNPRWLRKDFKKYHNQAFFYLYRQARSTLEHILPKPQPPKRHSCDWFLEDERIHKAITSLPDAQDLSISKIGYLIQDHGHLRRKLEKLPKTQNLLKKLNLIR